MAIGVYRYVLKKHPERFWHVADLLCYDVNDILIETIWVNKFYSIGQDWFIIYDSNGGSGTGFCQGEILRKIFIGDSEFQTI